MLVMAWGIALGELRLLGQKYMTHPLWMNLATGAVNHRKL